MADVQLENGYVQIANALLEALLYVKFSATQHKIVLAMIRLTWGWRQRTVRITHPEIAKRINTTAGGSFRKEFQELVRNGVLVEIEAAHGRTPAAYALNKDFEKWGGYCAPPGTLKNWWSERPESADKVRRVPAHGQSTLDLDARSMPVHGHSNEENEEIRPPVDGQATDRRVPSLSALTARERAGKSTGEGTLISASPCEISHLDPPKDSRKKEKEINSESNARENPRAAASVLSDFGRRILSAAFSAIAVKWPDAPVSASFGSSTEALAAEFQALGIAADLACTAIGNRIRGSKLPAPPSSIGYFERAVLDAHRDAEHEALKHAADIGAPRGGDPEPVAQLIDPHATARRKTLEAEYWRHHTAAGIAWGSDPDNAERYTLVVARATEQFRDLLETTWGEKARSLEVIARCAELAHFPPLADWLRAQNAEPLEPEQGDPP